MKYRRLDKNHDFTFGGGINDYLVDMDAFGQAIDTRLMLYTGEWWMDTKDGLPLWTKILGHPPFLGNKQKAVDLLITARISKTLNFSGISNIVSDYNPTNRAYTYSADVASIFGIVPVSV